MKRKFRLGMLPPLAALMGFIGLALWPQSAAQAAGEAISLCLTRLLPALFPYLVLSGLVLGMGWTRGLEKALAPVLRALFALPGACAGPLILGFIGGYPVGARSALALYEKGVLSRRDTERLLFFCNNSGPAFLLGAVGAGLFGDARAGLVFFAVHVLAALSAGLLSRLFSSAPKPAPVSPALPDATKPRFFEIFSGAVAQAVRACAAICGFVLFFAVISALLTACGLLPALTAGLSGLFHVPPGAVRAFLVGSMELTGGLEALREGAGSLETRMCLAAFLLGWGGFSVHGQVLALRENARVSLRPYLFGKLLHGVLSALCMRLFLAFSGFTLPAVNPVGLHNPAFSPVLSLLPLLLFAGICFFTRKRVY